MQSVSPRDHPCPDGGIGRRAGLKIQCPLKTCGFEPRSGHAKKTAASGLFWCPDGPFHPPPLRGCPQGGDWGKTPRPPPVTVFPLRRRFPFFDRTRACIGPIGGPVQAFFALFAGIGPINGPIRAPLGETREESDLQHVASNKYGLYCSLRNAPARQRERFQGFLLLREAPGRGSAQWPGPL